MSIESSGGVVPRLQHPPGWLGHWAWILRKLPSRTGPKNRGTAWALQKQRTIRWLLWAASAALPFHCRLVIILALSSSDFVSIVVSRAAFRSQMPMDGAGMVVGASKGASEYSPEFCHCPGTYLRLCKSLSKSRVRFYIWKLLLIPYGFAFGSVQPVVPIVSFGAPLNQCGFIKLCKTYWLLHRYSFGMGQNVATRKNWTVFFGPDFDQWIEDQFSPVYNEQSH